MAIGEVTGICRVCGEKFTIRKKFYKRKEAGSFERNAQEQYDLCPTCYREQKTQEKHEEKAAEPIIATVRISKTEEILPITIYLSGGTYPVKEQLKEQGYKWNCDDYVWIKSIQRENVKAEILSLKAIKETIAYNRMYQEAYEKWLNAHKKENCDKK